MCAQSTTQKISHLASVLMLKKNSSFKNWKKWIAAAAFVICVANFAGALHAAESSVPVPFDGAPTTWHDGFARYDFLMDEQTKVITPFKAPADEGFGFQAPPKGQRRCIVVAPKEVAPGNPWSWRGTYWDHQPQTEVELLKRGFYICYISVDMSAKPTKVDPCLEAWYNYLTQQHGLSKKPAYIGMSRGGEFAYIWATIHPDKVSCVYGDNPGDNQENLQRLEALAKQDVPLLNICGTLDPMVEKFSLIVEDIYHDFGGRVSMMIKEGACHHPHSLTDPKPIADFIEQSFKETLNPVAPPAYVGHDFKKYYYYSLETTFKNFPEDNFYITCRGPLFTDCYVRYIFQMPGAGEMSIIQPKNPAPGMPWVLRAGVVSRDDTVTQALLAKGYNVVLAPEPYADGPILSQWNALYKTLTENGFSKKVVLAGAGGAAGELYGWAIENPDKVACIYAENPLMHCTMTKKPLIDNLSVLANAGVPLMDVCGSLDPFLQNNALAVEKRYKDLGGKISVIVKEGVGHYPLSPEDPKSVVDFIAENIH
jgi:hypothetical protein